eukprot:Clim_evm40s22 gene=Clim_evmTU40s22
MTGNNTDTNANGTAHSVRVLMVDNYDSFTWNLYQYLSELGAHVTVHRNDKIDVQMAIAMNPTHLVLSPGPGSPKAGGQCAPIMHAFAGKIPILGVCLGEQIMFEEYGGTVGRCGEIKHGMTSEIVHDGKGVYVNLPQNTTMIRYHSLAGMKGTTPTDHLIETSHTAESGIIMGVRHKEYVMEGVQFHPESIKSDDGKQLLNNFLTMSKGTWKEDPGSWGM